MDLPIFYPTGRRMKFLYFYSLCLLILLLSSADLFHFSQNNYFRNTNRVSNGLDPDQVQHFVSLDPDQD